MLRKNEFSILVNLYQERTAFKRKTKNEKLDEGIEN